MAKVVRRPPSAAAAERFLGFPRGGGSVAPSPAGDDLPDLAEADVWYAAEPGSPRHPRRVEAEGRTGRRGGALVRGGLSRAFGEGAAGRPVAAASAPVEVPAWPARFAAPDPPLFDVDMEEDEEKQEGGGWVPPHVYLARRQARASVVEGVGRTLKGRDMSRVRDAVWSRTGFDG